MTEAASATDRGLLSLLALLDLSAAFVTVDHDILIQRLSCSFNLSGSVFSWFRFYLSSRLQSVHYNSSSTPFCPISCGVPQGSVLDPILFILYTSDVFSIINSFSLLSHRYADKRQIYC